MSDGNDYSSADDVPSGRHTPRILRALRSDTIDTCGSYTATLYDPENDIHSAQFEARLDRRNTNPDDVETTDPEESVLEPEVTVADRESDDTRRVSFDDNLERVSEIPPRGQPETITEETPADEVAPVDIETFPPVKGSALKGKYNVTKKQSKKQSFTSLQKIRDVKSAQGVKSKSTVRRSNSEKLPNRDVRSANSVRGGDKTSLHSPTSSLNKRHHKLGLIRQGSSLRQDARADSSDAADAQHDEIKLVEFPLSVLDSNKFPQDDVTSARRLYAWKAANGTMPDDAQTPSISPMWHTGSAQTLVDT